MNYICESKTIDVVYIFLSSDTQPLIANDDNDFILVT